MVEVGEEKMGATSFALSFPFLSRRIQIFNPRDSLSLSPYLLQRSIPMWSERKVTKRARMGLSLRLRDSSFRPSESTKSSLSNSHWLTET